MTEQDREPAQDATVWELSEESEAAPERRSLRSRLLRRPHWPRRRWFVWGYIGLLVLGGLVLFSRPTTTVEPGQVVFGRSLDGGSHDVGDRTSAFAVGDTFAYQAHLTAEAAGNALTIRATQTRPDGSTQTHDFPGPTLSASISQLSSSQLLRLAPSDAGSWTFQVLEGQTVLASGTFTVREGS